MTCKNCHSKLNADIHFCPNCGAKVIRNRLTIKNIWADISEQFLNFDNTFLKTFIHLFSKPEKVINGFIDGTRKKYMSVIQYFAISLTLVGVQVFLMNTFFKEVMLTDLSYLDGLTNPEVQKSNPFYNMKLEEFNSYQSLFYTISVPISAIATYVAYWVVGIRHYNFTEHLVINLYYSAQVVIITALLSILFLCFGLDYWLISSLVTILSFIYFFYVLKRVFKSSILEAFTYFLLVMVAFVAVLILLVILIALVVIIFKLAMGASLTKNAQ